ncbi:hypothetical protein CsatB_012978 [Cannabis sativa]|uniref:VQ domain-containing protein n=1 Tax=Cannabis sativa TaxID=3483 RepID=A0A7J6HZD4_CANSA|nr:VQ motif-containing protein 11 [Cannabis sativa]KAF4399770.1 hypothetical protein G4B88_022853 [Cannabis sativa]
MNSPTYGSDPVSPNTTFVQADPSTFRAVVQKLTGAPDDPSAQKLPLTLPSRFNNPKPVSTDMGPRRPAFKLHERRQNTKKLELNLTTSAPATTGYGNGNGVSTNVSLGRYRSGGSLTGLVGGGDQMMMVSPVSPFEFLARGSPRTPVSPSCMEEEEKEEEEKAIAGKGFYLHRSPLNTPRGSEPPELLTLFPLSSPRDNNNTNNHTNSSSTS